jgi:hypothetical protein
MSLELIAAVHESPKRTFVPLLAEISRELPETGATRQVPP